MPQNNPEGYAETSVVGAAADLHGKLLLIHGTVDDNVHPQNTLKLARELQQAGKRFEMMLYPETRHGPIDQKVVAHVQRTITEFILENL
jgi:dipeptidyl-peptidase-4